MKILVCCRACSPYRGSEPGMGWNFVRAIGRDNEVHVITEEIEYKDDIERYVSEHPAEMARFRFHFVRGPIHTILRKIWPPSFYWFYDLWLKRVLRLATELDKTEHFDITHQLNLIGYRAPGYLAQLGKPHVWGPIDGFNTTPWSIVPHLGLYGGLFIAGRNIVNALQVRFSRQVKTAVRRADAILVATKESQEVLLKRWNRASTLMPEVGWSGTTQPPPVRPATTGPVKICWSGVHEPRKALNLLLDAIEASGCKDSIDLHILGAGPRTTAWKRKARKAKIDNVIWHGWVPHDQAKAIMRSCDAFALSSMSDATTSVLLEALSFGLPVIAPDHLGFSHVIDDTCGIKIPIRSYGQFIRDYGQALKRLCEDTTLRTTLSVGATQRVSAFTWDEKATVLADLYRRVTQGVRS